MAIGSSAGTINDIYEATSEAYETAAQALRTSAQEFATGFTRLNWKLLEFGRANAQTNLEHMRSMAGVRTMRDFVDLQTAYMRGQYNALTAQFRELQSSHHRARREDDRAAERPGHSRGPALPNLLTIRCGRRSGARLLSRFIARSRVSPPPSAFTCKQRPIGLTFRAGRHAAVAQPVRALDCGSRGRLFEPGQRYHLQPERLHLQQFDASQDRSCAMRSSACRWACISRKIR